MAKLKLSQINNTFFECEGSLVLRHGNNALVSGNWFIGNGKKFTGGVRVINAGHKIINNYFYKLAGDEFRSGTAIMNGIPDSPANGYAQVKNVMIANNTYYDCAFPWGFGVGLGERNRTARPEGVLLLNNLLYCPNTSELIKHYDVTDGIMLDNNLLIGSAGVSKEKGTVEGDVLKSKLAGLDVVYTNLKAKKLPFVKYDILGQERINPVIGAFQNQGENPAIELATSKNCGPEWYKSVVNSVVEKPKPQGKTTEVTPGADNLSKAIKKAGNGDVLLLTAGEYVISNKVVISKDLTIKSADAKVKPVIRLESGRDNNAFFEIGGTAKVRFVGVSLNGNNKAKYPAKYAIISAKEGANGYSVFMDNCEVYDFNVESGAIFKAYKGSMADSLKISNSVIRDSYRGFALNDEKDDVGKYSVENVVFDNTVFSNFTQYILDFYRGGNDESTLGGALEIEHCVFDDIAGDEKQTVLKLTNIVRVDIKNSIFSNSMAKTVVRLSGTKNSITNCCFYNCANPKATGGAVSVNIISENPKFEKKSFVLSKKSSLRSKAADGGNIGLR